MIDLGINRAKELIEQHTNLPFYSFVDIKQSQDNANIWIIQAQVVTGADTASVYIREIQLEIEVTDDKLALVSLRTIGNKSYWYTFACNHFHPPIKCYWTALRQADNNYQESRE